MPTIERISKIRAHARNFRVSAINSDIAHYAFLMNKAARELEYQAQILERELRVEMQQHPEGAE